MRVKEIWDRIEADVFEESQLQIPDPEKGPLERRIGRTYEDALFEDHVDMNDTSYWFTTPDGAPPPRQGSRLRGYKQIYQGTDAPFRERNALKGEER